MRKDVAIEGNGKTKLQTIRVARGYSQSKLARLSGVGIRAIQNYEQGVVDIRHAPILMLQKLCDALGCSISDIV